MQSNQPSTGRGEVSRRSFVKGSAAVAVGASFGAPAILRADDKAGDKPLIVGSGDHTYEVITDWAKLPDQH